MEEDFFSVYNTQCQRRCIDSSNKMKKKYHTVRSIPKLTIKTVERDNIDTANTQIDNISLSWLDTYTSIQGDGVKLVVWAQNNYI